MVTLHLKNAVMKSFVKSYKSFLKNYIYKNDDAVKKIFKDSKCVSACELVAYNYLSSAEEFYKKNPYGTYVEERKYIANDPNVRKNFELYKKIVPDELLLGYLQIYMYCVEELGGVIYDKDQRSVKENISVLTVKGAQKYTLTEYLTEVINNFCIEMYKRVAKDLKAGNYWWLRDTATTLRRQLYDNFIYVNTARFKHMIRQYLEVEMSDAEIQKNIINSMSGSIEIGKKLDSIMEKKYNAKPYYCWWETNNNKNTLHLDEVPPQNNIYTYVAYHTKPNEHNQNTDKYFL